MKNINNLKYHIVTYGCQMNEHDTELLKGLIEAMNYNWVENVEDADLLLLNTCCVREKAENKVIGHLGEFKRLKQRNPHLILGVCGCMTQQEGMAERIREKAPHVDLIFGTFNTQRLPELLDEARETSTTLIEVWDEEGQISEERPIKRSGQLKAYVTITYGCNNFCSYCIVPYVRGRERSREPGAIVSEIEELSREGFKEIMLLGQNVNSYGHDLDKPIDFADLLKLVNKIDGVERIRYMTSHPRDFTSKLIRTIAESDKVCEHFHLPIQSGSDRILKEMNRGYTRGYYLDLIQKIKTAVPNCTLTTDIIVGFPGETQEDFLDTLDILQKVRFDSAFTFLYSPRTGTPAAEWVEVDEDIKKERFQELLELQNQISMSNNQRFLGRLEEILVEGTSKRNEERLTGRTRGNKIVVFEGDETLIGKLVTVKITEAQTWSLFGELCK